jgi:general stress protein 26
MVNDKTANDIQRVRGLIKKIGFAMLVTRDGDRLRARPMSDCLDRGTKAILVLTDARRHKVSM